MARCIASVTVALSMLFAGGCLSSAADGRAILQEELDLFNELNTTLTGIKDGPAAKNAIGKVRELCDKIVVTQEKANKTKVMKSTEGTLETEFKGKFEQAGMSVGMQMMRVSTLEGGNEIQSAITSMLTRMQASAPKK